MKSFFQFTVIILLSVLTVSCRSALQITASEAPVVATKATNPVMDFVGFKNASRNNNMLEGFGAEVERRHIAFNSQPTYSGGFNLQELSLYPAKNRYVVYIDVVAHNYMPNDAVHYNGDLELGAWLVAGLSAFTLFPVYIPMFIFASPNDSRITLNGRYVVCLYDTEEKRLLNSWPYEINITDDYKGEYYNGKTNRAQVDGYYRQKLYNTLLEGMMTAYNWIQQRQ